MKQIWGAAEFTVLSCITPEEAKRPGGRFSPARSSKNCRYDRFDDERRQGRRGDALPGPAAGTMTMTVRGTFSPDSYTDQVSMKCDGRRQGAMDDEDAA